MKVAISIDKLALSTRSRFDIRYPHKKIPNFKFANYVVNGNPGKDYKKETKKDKNIIKYLTVMKFKHVETGNILVISNQRKDKYWAASPVYIIFYPGISHHITYPDVLAVEQFFLRECGIKLQISVVHLAVDLVWRKRRKNRYKKILRHFKPGSKKPYRPRKKKKTYKSGNYFGAPYSSNQLLTYDKARQLRKVKKIDITGDIFRIEQRLNVPQMNNFIQSIDDLAVQDWSFLYPKYFSFHSLKPDFAQKIDLAGESWRRPIWRLKKLAKELFNINSSNFYRDCLVDHPRLSDPVREALATYRWCANFRQYQS